MTGALLVGLVGAALGFVGSLVAPRWTQQPVRTWETIALCIATAVLGGLLAVSLGAVGMSFTGVLGYLRLWVALLFTGVLVLASFVDLSKRIIPNELMIWTLAGVGVLTLAEEVARRILQRRPGALVGWLTQLTTAESLLQGVLGLLAGGGVLLLLALLFSGGMGLGDVKLAGVFGLFLGWQQTLVALFLGFWLGGIGVAILLLLGRVKLGRKDMIAFGPYLAGGAVAALIFGPLLLQWYTTSAGL